MGEQLADPDVESMKRARKQKRLSVRQEEIKVAMNDGYSAEDIAEEDEIKVDGKTYDFSNIKSKYTVYTYSQRANDKLKQYPAVVDEMIQELLIDDRNVQIEKIRQNVEAACDDQE